MKIGSILVGGTRAQVRVAPERLHLVSGLSPTRLRP